MANFGRPNSNNSQFFITTVDSPHCDGSNVVFGKVLRGLGCLQEMEKYASDESEPLLVRQSITFGSSIKFSQMKTKNKSIDKCFILKPTGNDCSELW